ncbi:Ca-activated chloride channel family protein [Atopomonas hussainii]|uniref:Ca-activated chloride channel family protein n=2 Tax=Atopomonas hussainii TaxID=1429083 RepID=A0A1H7GZV3_9GAMM|nr:Ca-activated chloride channel family protein [Atopomonas hussainii]
MWPHFERPYLLLLLIPVALIGWYQWRHAKRLGQWQSLLPVALHPWLLSGRDVRPSRLPKALLAIAWLLAVLALSGPSWEKLEQPSYRSSDALVIVLDASQFMLASDVQPNRLAHAKRKIMDLLESRDDALTGIVVYAGSSHTLVPLSNDLGTARNLLDAVKPDIMPLAGQRADLGVARAVKLLEQGGRPQGRILLLTSAISADAEQALSEQTDSYAGRLSILGFGTAEGAPIPLSDGSLLKDQQGRIVLPRTDSAQLAQQATAIDAGFSMATLDNRDIDALGLNQRQLGYQRSQEQRLNRWHDQGYWLLLPLVLLAASAARRGWLMALLLCFTLPLPQQANAFGWDDLWLRPDQQGERLLNQQQAAAAASTFADLAWRAEALYQAGDYQAAAKLWARQDGANADYNRGNALAKAGELSAALAAYDEALDLDPGLSQAADNRALVEALLKQQEQQQKEQNGQNDAQGEQQQAGQNADDSQQGQSANPQGQPQPEAGNQSPSSGNSGTPSEQQGAGASTGGEANTANDSPAPAESSSATESTDNKATTAPESSSSEAADPSADIGLAGIEALPDFEREAALELWLKQIPDEPSELLRRKFWYQQQQESQP